MKQSKKLVIAFIIITIIFLLLYIVFLVTDSEKLMSLFLGLFTSSIIALTSCYVTYRIELNNYLKELANSFINVLLDIETFINNYENENNNIDYYSKECRRLYNIIKKININNNTISTFNPIKNRKLKNIYRIYKIFNNDLDEVFQHLFLNKQIKSTKTKMELIESFYYCFIMFYTSGINKQIINLKGVNYSADVYIDYMSNPKRRKRSVKKVIEDIEQKYNNDIKYR